MGYDALPKIETRKEMHDQLQQAIENIGEESELDEDFEYLGKGKKYLKGLIIESNISSNLIKNQSNIELIPTSDETIKILKILNPKNKAISYSYLDVVDPRFWILYSLDSSQDIRREIKKLIQLNNSNLDYAWFSSSSLQSLSKGYSKTNFSMRFNNYFQNCNIPMKKLSIRLWAEDASDIVDNILKNEYIGKGACLSNIELLISNYNNQYVKTRLDMMGSINVSKGNSLEKFLEFQTNTIQGHYKPLIEDIENNYRMEYNCDQNGINIKGNIISIRLKEKVDDIEQKCSAILKGTNPFRFSGFATKVDDEDYLLNVIDLHNYGHFDMEFFSDEILINLPKNACGNSVMRLYALCQEQIDPKAILIGGDERALLSSG